MAAATTLPSVLNAAPDSPVEPTSTCRCSGWYKSITTIGGRFPNSPLMLKETDTTFAKVARVAATLFLTVGLAWVAVKGAMAMKSCSCLAAAATKLGQYRPSWI